MSNDPNLEPKRKAYLIQNLLVSKYIVAQQKRMGSLGNSAQTSAPMTPVWVPNDAGASISGDGAAPAPCALPIHAYAGECVGGVGVRAM